MLKYLNQIKEEICTYKKIQDETQLNEQVPVLANVIQHMSANNLKKAFKEIEFLQLEKGEKVFEERDQSDGAYLILSGKIGIVRGLHRRGTLVKPKSQPKLIKRGTIASMQLPQDISMIQHIAPTFIKTHVKGDTFGEACLDA